MKNQYVGDKKDYLKYGFLRAIIKATGWRLFVAWYLTPDDNTGHGSDIVCFDQPDQYQHFDPELFQKLAEITLRGQLRHISLIEQNSLLPRASFFSGEVPRQPESRDRWFAKLRNEAIDHEFVFMDPDNGLEVNSVSYHRQGATKYAYWRELSILWAQGQSLVVYQHKRRKSVTQMVHDITKEAKMHLPEVQVSVAQGSGVLFLMFLQPKHQSQRSVIVKQVTEQCGTLLTMQVGEAQPNEARQVDQPVRVAFVSGQTDSTQIDYLNRNRQRNHGTRGQPGTDHNQLAYKLVCQQSDCGYVYGANGSDIFQRRCPKCQGGSSGINF